ncbi:MAG: hypothetical protein AAGF12_40750 [Myxococcota bacterium]
MNTQRTQTRWLAWNLALLLSAAAVDPGRVNAQCEDQAQARALFERGLEEAASRSLAAARDAYLESLELCARVPTAYNLAVIQRQLGETVAAVRILGELQDATYGELDDGQRDVIEALFREVRNEIGFIEVAVSGARVASVVIEGEAVGTVEEDGPSAFPVLPGPYTVVAAAPDGRSAETRTSVRAGATVELDLELPLSPDRGRLIVEAEADQALEILGVAQGRSRLVRHVPPSSYTVRLLEGDVSETVEVDAGETYRIRLSEAGWAESPWLWIVIGALVVGAGVATAVILTQGSEDPISDPVWGRVEL